MGKRAIKWTDVEVQPGFLGFSDSLFEAPVCPLDEKHEVLLKSAAYQHIGGGHFDRRPPIQLNHTWPDPGY